MNSRKVIVYGFGTLLFVMAAAQFLSFSHFYHVMLHYLLPMGEGVKLLGPFSLPIVFVFTAMHGLGACGFLLLGKDNALRPAFVKIGVAAVVIWVVLITSILIRDVPTIFVGFFGDKLRQSVSWVTLVQATLFVAWGWVAYKLQDNEA